MPVLGVREPPEPPQTARPWSTTRTRRRLFRIGVVVVAVALLVGLPWLISRPPPGAESPLGAAVQMADALAAGDAHAVRRIVSPDLPDRTARAAAVLAAVDGGPFVADSVAVRPIAMAPAFEVAELHGSVGGRDVVVEVHLHRFGNGRWYVESLTIPPG